MGNSKKKKQSYSDNNMKKKTNSLGIGFFVIPLIILFFLFALIITLLEDKEYIYISPVFKNYQPLEKSEDEKIENYFNDEIGLFYDEERHYLINDSVEYLYDKTGVKVFIWGFSPEINSNGKYIPPSEEDAQKLCKEALESLTKYGIDLVLIYVPTNSGFETHSCSTNEVEDNYGQKFEKILCQYLNYNFHDAGEIKIEDYDVMFYYSLRQTADRIMGGVTSPLALIKENLRFFILLTVTLVVVVSSLIFYKRFERK